MRVLEPGYEGVLERGYEGIRAGVRGGIRAVKKTKIEGVKGFTERRNPLREIYTCASCGIKEFKITDEDNFVFVFVCYFKCFYSTRHRYKFLVTDYDVL